MSSLQESISASADFASWRRGILKRGGYKCLICGSKYRVQVHHLDSLSLLFEKHGITKDNWRQFANIIFDPENGVAICYKHHNKSNSISFHSRYGRNRTMKDQFLQYLAECQKGSSDGRRDS